MHYYSEDPIVLFEATKPFTGGVSRSTIDRWEHLGIFPKRIQIGPRRVGWKLSDLKAWAEERPNGMLPANQTAVDAENLADAGVSRASIKSA